MPEKNKARTRRLPDVGRPPPHMTCIWWTHPKRMTMMVGRIRSRTSLLKHLQSVDVSGAAQNRIAKKTAIPAPEIITLRRTPKTSKPTSEQYDWADGQVNPDDPVENEDLEDSNYLPPFEEDVSLGDEDFIVPEEPLEQERFKRQLIATARSLKKKRQQLQAEQDTLNDRWT